MQKYFTWNTPKRANKNKNVSRKKEKQDFCNKKIRLKQTNITIENHINTQKMTVFFKLLMFLIKNLVYKIKME